MKKVNQRYPIRILHIVGGMDTGGVETWLMHVLRRIDRDRYRFDFLTHTTKPCFYDDEIRSLGCRIIPCAHLSRPWRYARNFRRILKEYGPYDAVHSHVHHFSGFPLMLTHCSGVPTRIAHSHNDISLNDGRAGLWRKLYLRTTEWLIRCHATIGLACSSQAAANLFGKYWKNDQRWRVLYYGIDLEPFKSSVNRDEVRRELRIPSNAFVLGHVGRFVEQKNHDFLLDIFVEVVQREPSTYLLLVGDGSLREGVAQKVQRLGLMNKVIFTGVRSDVPRLMLGAMDIFVLPSRYEGLGLVIVEAQAAGLRCVISDVVPREADVTPLLIYRLALSQPEIWADCIMAIKNKDVILADAWKELEKSRFTLSECVDNLTRCYLFSYNIKERLL